jgi:hypothetical protein
MMGTVIGFTIYRNISLHRVPSLIEAQNQAISHFEWLERKSLKIGETCLDLWGHKEVMDWVHTMPDGSVVVLIGSFHNQVSWQKVEADLLEAKNIDEFVVPWEGRVIFVRVSADGRYWTIWNDWIGSIPVFHAKIGDGRIASTLEPVVVAAAGYTPDDFYLPGLVCLLINGHFISDWTLYKGMKTVLPDSVAVWDASGYRVKKVWSVEPSQDRWEVGWDDLVDEMYELSHKTIAEVFKTQSTWILPLSSGLDSRLIAGVAADVGANVFTYAWGASNTTDVFYSKQIAKSLGFPWKHINLSRDFLLKYTRRWAELFGSGLHFHGMYLMSFLDELESEPDGPIISGFIGDSLAGVSLVDLEKVHSIPERYQINSNWHIHWDADEVIKLVKFPVEDALDEISQEIKRQIDVVPGTGFQKLLFLQIWSRQNLFTSFQLSVSSWWRDVMAPFINREYARFCMSLPRVALDHRRLQTDLYRRYYGRLAVIPGTYANEPMILTGRYLLNRRIAKRLPKLLQRGPFAGFEKAELRMSIDSARACGRDSFWPLFDTWEQLSEWLDVDYLENAWQSILKDREDYKSRSKLQSVQTLAYRLK